MSDMTQYNSVSARISKKERVTHPALRLLISAAVILGLWQLIVVVFDMPSFILPSPIEVLDRLVTRYDVLLKHTWVTAQEILLGLALGLSMGLLFALQMLMFEPLKRWLLPILIASQAIPVFAIAPVLMLWLGYNGFSLTLVSFSHSRLWMRYSPCLKTSSSVGSGPTRCLKSGRR